MSLKKYDDAIILTCRTKGFQVTDLLTRPTVGDGKRMVLVQARALKSGDSKSYVLQQAYAVPNVEPDEARAIALQRFLDDLPRKINKYWLGPPPRVRDMSRPRFKP